METENNRTRSISFGKPTEQNRVQQKPDLAWFPCINLPAFNKFPKAFI